MVSPIERAGTLTIRSNDTSSRPFTQQSEVGKEILDLAPLEELEPRGDAIGNPRVAQPPLHRALEKVGAVEHGDVAEMVGSGAPEVRVRIQPASVRASSSSSSASIHTNFSPASLSVRSRFAFRFWLRSITACAASRILRFER
mgnify:CR=1 FL=1